MLTPHDREAAAREALRRMNDWTIEFLIAANDASTTAVSRLRTLQIALAVQAHRLRRVLAELEEVEKCNNRKKENSHDQGRAGVGDRGGAAGSSAAP